VITAFSMACHLQVLSTSFAETVNFLHHKKSFCADYFNKMAELVFVTCLIYTCA